LHAGTLRFRLACRRRRPHAAVLRDGGERSGCGTPMGTKTAATSAQGPHWPSWWQEGSTHTQRARLETLERLGPPARWPHGINNLSTTAAISMTPLAGSGNQTM